jgi:hypothetical protein
MEMPGAEFSSNRSQMLTRPRKIEKTRRELASEISASPLLSRREV